MSKRDTRRGMWALSWRVTPRIPGAALCVQMTDLEILLTVLPSTIDRLHYLVKRTEFERRTSYLGDELDLLCLYLETGLTLPEGMDEQGIIVSGLSERLHPYFMAKDRDSLPHPGPRRSKWWRDILAHLEGTGPAGWAKAGCYLCDVPYDIQTAVENEVQAARSHLRSGRAEDDDQGDLEVCGVLVVDKQQNLDLVFAKNHSSRSCRFEIDLDEVRDIRRDMKARGMTVVGSFHSHPVGLWMPGPGDCESAALNFLMLVYDVTGRQLASWRIVKAGERKTSVVVRSP